MYKVGSVSLFHIRSSDNRVTLLNLIVASSRNMLLIIGVFSSELEGFGFCEAIGRVSGLNEGHRFGGFISANIWIIGLLWFPGRRSLFEWPLNVETRAPL